MSARGLLVAALLLAGSVRSAAGNVLTTLSVRETAGVARDGEVATGGVPLPRRLGLRSTAGLAILDARGRRVPAELRVLARWNAGRDDATAPLQWVLASFPATVAAGGSARYRLVAGAPAGAAIAGPRLRLTRSGRQVVVATGAATFRLGGDPGALFDEVRGAGGALLSGGSAMTVTAAGRTAGHPKIRSIRVETTGPLRAVVVVEGEYGLPPLGGGALSSLRRYEFTAGSPTAIVRQVVRWEGSLANHDPNGWRLERVRDRLDLPAGLARRALIVGSRAAPALAGPARPGAVRIEQERRANRKAPLRFAAEAAGASARGEKADGGVLAVGGPAGTLAVALARMQRYEPEALRLLADGGLAIDLAAGPVWLAHHQGFFATLAVAALPPDARREELDREVWAPLNRPLRPWPDAAWFHGSQAVAELPAGRLPAGLERYDATVRGLLERTLRAADAEGLAGLTTFGLLPRAWGMPWGSPELDCKRDPTPGDAADDAFWCGTWTDYHNTLATVPAWAMRSGEVEWLDELAFPGALRTLHTQMMQCAPGDPWFYCGQAPAGYGGYRADFNSSHAYFENLFLYYWLTGDSTVPATLQRGAESMRRRFCPQRKEPGGAACGATEPLPRGVSLTGRIAAQWLAAFRFLGLAGDDPSFLDDFRSGLARAVTLQYAEVERGGRRYGFLAGPLAGPGTYTTGPILQHALYDAENLHRLMVDGGDAPIGSPPLRPSRVLAALARTVADLERGGGARGPAWPQRLRFTWSGARVGGTLTAVAPDSRPLYGPERASAAALLVRAGAITGDQALLAAGREVALAALAASAKDKAPLGKVQGQYLLRLHAAVGRLADVAKQEGGR